jgi:hypothetical protein
MIPEAAVKIQKAEAFPDVSFDNAKKIPALNAPISPDFHQNISTT